MAFLRSDIPFFGSLGDITAYQPRNSSKIVVRRKSGPSKHAIATLPSFEQTRRLNQEFKGRVVAAEQMQNCFSPLKCVVDYNVRATLIGLMAKLQKWDTKSKLGTRSILFSEHAKAFEGFSLTKKIALDTLMKAPVKHTFNIDTLTASVEIPAIFPGINLKLPARYDVYCFKAVLSILPDVIYRDEHYIVDGKADHPAHVVSTPWEKCSEGINKTNLNLGIKASMLPPKFTLVLAFGICFGNWVFGNTIEEVKYAGSAKVLGVVM